VDYASVTSITEALQGVHTVISTVLNRDEMIPADNLLKGAIAAGVKRFAPSEFAAVKEANFDIELYRMIKVPHWNDVKNSGMEYTAFRNGLFMDYFAAGSSYHGPLKMFPFVVNVKERTAEIPGTGDEKGTFTTVADIGKFVSAAVTLDKWPEELGMSGETLSYNEIVRRAEEVIGEKFKVTYLSVEELEKRREESIEKKDMWGQFSAEAFLVGVKGKGEIKDPYLNKTTDVQPTKITEFLQKYWGKA
ncbi:hypothetical protein BDQ17DRAFT_1362784, partial [Cyathus striatus]